MATYIDENDPENELHLNDDAEYVTLTSRLHLPEKGVDVSVAPSLSHEQAVALAAELLSIVRKRAPEMLAGVEMLDELPGVR